MVRSYIGFDVPVKRVTGWQQQASVAEHAFRDRMVMEERARHAVLEFENGALGFHGFSSIALGSPIRGLGRLTGFYAEKGMAFGDEMSLLTGPDTTETLNVERTVREVGGREVLKSVKAGDWVWENPYFEHGVSETHVALASTLDEMIRAVREGGEPEYGAWNGRVDREVDLAITRSHEAGNVPVELPLS
jgi:predicted dehydrogenase